MKKRLVILLGAGIAIFAFLLVWSFTPKQLDIYTYQVNSNGTSDYYKSTTPKTCYGIMNYFVSERRISNCVGEVNFELLKKPHELTHEEKWDILNSDCPLTLQNLGKYCEHGHQADVCHSIYPKTKGFYCEAIFNDLEYLGDKECRVIHSLFFEKAKEYRDPKKGLMVYEYFEDYCKNKRDGLSLFQSHLELRDSQKVTTP